MKMSSFSIRDILNLPEDRIRSLNAKGEEQMSIQERRSFAIAIHGADDQDEDMDAQNIAKSSMNNLTVTEFFSLKLGAHDVFKKQYRRFKWSAKD